MRCPVRTMAEKADQRDCGSQEKVRAGTNRYLLARLYPGKTRRIDEGESSFRAPAERRKIRGRILRRGAPRRPRWK
jgi:hypothetical protein